MRDVFSTKPFCREFLKGNDRIFRHNKWKGFIVDLMDVYDCKKYLSGNVCPVLLPAR